MFVRLVISGGPHLGTIAEIKEGYYLVGRNAECQIRPESPHVGERHCVFQHQGRHFGICDLGSGAITKVNRKSIQAKKWKLLNHGDRVLIGDVPFIVVITAIDPNAPIKPATQNRQPKSPPAAPSPKKNRSSEDTVTGHDTAELDVSDLGLSPEIDQSDLTDGIRWREE